MVFLPWAWGERRLCSAFPTLSPQRAAGSFPHIWTQEQPWDRTPLTASFQTLFILFCLVLSPTERSEEPNCTIQIIPNTVIRGGKKTNLIKILIATLKCFLWNYQSCQYPIINVQKYDYLFNKNREIPAFKLVIVAKQNAVIMHQNLGSQL